MTFGEKLRMLRTARGLNQKDLAALTGISNALISRIETGKMLPGPEWEQRLRKALGWDENAERGLAILVVQTEQEPV